MGGVRAAAAARIAAGQLLRENVRRNAVVGHVGESNSSLPTPGRCLIRRRWSSVFGGAIAATPLGITVARALSKYPAASSGRPPPQEVLQRDRGGGTYSDGRLPVPAGIRRAMSYDPKSVVTVRTGRRTFLTFRVRRRS